MKSNNVLFQGERKFNRTHECRYCYQLDKSNYTCDTSNASCKVINGRIQKYITQCTVKDNVICLGECNCYIMMVYICMFQQFDQFIRKVHCCIIISWVVFTVSLIKSSPSIDGCITWFIYYRYKGYQFFFKLRWFSPGTLVSSTNKTDRHDIIEILLKVALNTIARTISLNCPFTIVLPNGLTKFYL
jgi:hypothetical protein